MVEREVVAGPALNAAVAVALIDALALAVRVSRVAVDGVMAGCDPVVVAARVVPESGGDEFFGSSAGVANPGDNPEPLSRNDPGCLVLG